jgi:ribosome-binding protein aMBF1 (putative translation factor)
MPPPPGLAAPILARGVPHPPGRRAAAMTPDELLRRYPRETLRWLRAQLGLTQLDLAHQLGANYNTVPNWESRRYAISPAYRARLVLLLAPHLATPEGAAFAQSLGRGEAPQA